MQGYSVVLSGDPDGFAQQLRDHLERHEDVFSRIDVIATALPLEQRLASDPPDLVTLDLGLAGLGGVPGAERLVRWYRTRMSSQAVPAGRRLVVVSPTGDDGLVARACAWGADYFVVRPFDVATLGLRFRQLVTGERGPLPSRRQRRLRQIERCVVRYMEDLGVPPHYKGRAYLKDAIVMVVEDRGLLERVTKELYPRIARLHQTAPFKVERAIRHAIEVTVERGNLSLIERLFAHLINDRRARPTNSSFIALLADQVRLEICGLAGAAR